MLKWAFSDEAKFRDINIDQLRVAFMGNSAGGNLTATLSILTSFTSGANKKFRDGLPPNYQQKYQALLYPSTETGVPYGDRWRRASQKVQEKSLPVGVAELMEDSYLPPYVDREQVLVCPLQADADLLRGLHLPPALVLTAGLDCLKQEADDYAAKLQAAGVSAEAHDYPEAVHGFSHYKKGPNYRPDDIKECWDRISGGLKSAFE